MVLNAVTYYVFKCTMNFCMDDFSVLFQIVLHIFACVRRSYCFHLYKCSWNNHYQSNIKNTLWHYILLGWYIIYLTPWVWSFIINLCIASPICICLLSHMGAYVNNTFSAYRVLTIMNLFDLCFLYLSEHIYHILTNNLHYLVAC